MTRRIRSSLNPLCSVFIFALIAASLFAGCEKAIPLEERVKAYWDARKARNFVAAYKMEDPRSGVDENLYISRLAGGKVAYESVSVAEIQSKEDQAQVTLDIGYSVAGLPKTFKSKLKEEWYRIGRQWYHQMPVKTGAKPPRPQFQPPTRPQGQAPASPPSQAPAMPPGQPPASPSPS